MKLIANVNLDAFHEEIKLLHKEMEKTNALLLGLIPEVKASKKELDELKKIKAEMDAGQETPYSQDLF